MQVVLDRLSEEKLDEIISHFTPGALHDQEGLAGRMMVSVAESITNPVFLRLRAGLLPLLRDLLMYQHNGLVSTALALIFRLSMMRSETTSLLRDVQLMLSPEIVDFYRQAMAHAVKLQRCGGREGGGGGGGSSGQGHERPTLSGPASWVLR